MKNNISFHKNVNNIINIILLILFHNSFFVFLSTKLVISEIIYILKLIYSHFKC